jgi:hypothetical protein
MACFGRTATPRVGQADAPARVLGAAGGLVVLLLACSKLCAQPAGSDSQVPPASANGSPGAPGAGQESTPVPGDTGPAALAGNSSPVSLNAVEDIVEVDPGATCLERGRLVQRVARWLDRAAVEIPLRVQVRGDPRVATRVFFSVRTDPGSPAERRLDNVPSDCDQLHSAVALSVALAIEATLQQGVASTPPKRRAEPSQPMHLELALLGGASIGVLTDTSLTGSPRLTLTPLPWLQLAVATLGTYVNGQSVEPLDGRFDLTLLAIGLDGCVGGEATPALGFFMCVGGRGGPFRSEGRGFPMRIKSTRGWWALTGSAQVRFWLSSVLALGASMEALYAPMLRRITVNGPDGLPIFQHTVSNVALSITVGPVFRLF